MATEVKLPELGENVEKGDVLRVLVKPGDTMLTVICHGASSVADLVITAHLGNAGTGATGPGETR